MTTQTVNCATSMLGEVIIPLRWIVCPTGVRGTRGTHPGAVIVTQDLVQVVVYPQVVRVLILLAHTWSGDACCHTLWEWQIRSGDCQLLVHTSRFVVVHVTILGGTEGRCASAVNAYS